MVFEYTLPLNLISKVSAPMLKVKEPVGLLWNLLSMSELFTGLMLPFESCPKPKKIIIIKINIHEQIEQEDIKKIINKNTY